MTRILVVDDLAIFREPIAKALELAGYTTCSASTGHEALNLAFAEPFDLILLDLAMPGMDGVKCLDQLRAADLTRGVPVIVLTAMADRDIVALIAKMGVSGYLLKASFSMEQLLAKIRDVLGPAAARGAAPRLTGDRPATVAVRAAPVAPEPARPRAAPEESAPRTAYAQLVKGQPGPAPPPPSGEPIRLTRAEVLQRIEGVVRVQTLAGSVAEVLSIAGSPRSDAASLGEALGRDAVIAGRVLQVANSAAYVRSKPQQITSIEEAIRTVGFSTVRNLAAAVGVYEMVSGQSSDSGNVLRFWQHSFAVAALMERLTEPIDDIPAATAHLVGLCHDLAEIIFRQEFSAEYGYVLDLARHTGRNTVAIETEVFEMSRVDLMSFILKQLALPATIAEPIREFLRRRADRSMSLGRLARVLRIANYFARGLLLAPPDELLVGPITREECRNALDTDAPPPIDVVALRNEVITLTALLARVSVADVKTRADANYSPMPVRAAYVRHGDFAKLDPLAAALGILTTLEVHGDLPDPEELADVDAVVLALPDFGSRGWDQDRVRALYDQLTAKGIVPLVLQHTPTSPGGSPAPSWYRLGPVPLGELAKALRRPQTIAS